MDFEFITEKEDLLAAWQRYIALATSPRDPYADAEYVWLNRWIEAGTPAAIAAEDFWYPFVMRPIPEIFKIPGLDVTSPYGFGGPLTSNPQTLGAFCRYWDDFCEKHNVVAEFIRFNPYLENHLRFPVEKHHVKDVVWFDLSLSKEALEQNSHPQKRRYLKKQDFEFSDRFEGLSSFVKLYQDAMQEKHADRFYQFPQEVFQHLNPNTCWVHSVYHEGEVISAALFLVDGQTVQYFLGANNEIGKALKSSAWLLWQTALKAKKLGYQRYILGGGMQKDDSLFRFKQQLSCLTLPYWIGRKIHNAKNYQQIIDTAEAHYPGWYTETAPLFFYRGRPPEKA